MRAAALGGRPAGLSTGVPSAFKPAPLGAPIRSPPSDRAGAAHLRQLSTGAVSVRP
jgi:hypothetical protein